MLSLFRTNQIIFSFLLLLYAFLLRSGTFFLPFSHQVPAIEQTGVFPYWLENTLAGYPPVAVSLLTVLIVFIQAVIINDIVGKRRIFREQTLFPGLFYIMLVSAVHNFLPLSAILIGNTFLIIAMGELLKISRSRQNAGTIFNVGFWLGVAVLFYNAFVFFILMGLSGLIWMRGVKTKEILMILCGFMIPFLYAATWFFWHDQLPWFWEQLVINQTVFLDFTIEGRYTFVKLGLLSVLFLAGIFNGYQFDKSYQTKNHVNIIYLAFFISGLTFFIQKNIGLEHFLISMPPLSILLAGRFLSVSKTTAEFLHLLILTAIMLLQYEVIRF